MLLAVDIGNTNTKLALYEGRQLVADWRIATDKLRTSDGYGLLLLDLFAHRRIDPRLVEAVVISSVVPPVISAWEQMCRQYFGQQPLVVGHGIRTGLPIKVENPKKVGADRIVNAVAALEKYGGPVIAVDFGTATKFEVVSERGEYLGGVIAPGLAICADALVQQTAQLPRIELAKPMGVMGKNTISSMQAGVIYGAVGQVNEIVPRLKKELGSDAYVVATGGLAGVICQETDEIDEVNPFLTLEGLRIIYERNRRDDSPGKQVG